MWPQPRDPRSPPELGEAGRTPLPQRLRRDRGPETLDVRCLVSRLRENKSAVISHPGGGRL